MRNLLDDRAAAEAGDGLPLRACSSCLIASDPDLVLQDGGNTSWKTTRTDRFGTRRQVIWVKASGFELGRMGPEGFTALTRHLRPSRRSCMRCFPPRLLTICMPTRC